MLEVGADTRPERLDVLELTHVLGKLVVELRQVATLDRLHRDGIRDGGVRQLPVRVVRRERDGERLDAAVLETEQLFVESGRVGLGAVLDRHVLVRVAGAGRIGAVDVDGDHVAVDDAAVLNDVVAGRTLTQSLQRVVQRVVRHGGRLAGEGDGGEVAQLERRQRIERRGERQRPPFLDDDLADVRRTDRFEPLLTERGVDGTGHHLVRHVVENLVLVALADNPGGHLARTEARDARLARVVARDALDLGIDQVARDFNRQALAGFVDVDEFGFHAAIFWEVRG